MSRLTCTKEKPAARPRPDFRNWRRPLDALGICLGLGYAAPALLYPHGNDQALHWYVGQGILRGELPYQHAVSGKPVGIFVVHALSSILFGPTQWAIRAFEILCLLPMSYWLVALARAPEVPRRDGQWGAAALLLYGTYYTFFDYWDISHPELWVALCSLWSAHVAVFETRPTRRLLTCGALGAAAFMFKYTAAAIALPIAAYCGLRAVREGTGRGQLASMALALPRAACLYLFGAIPVFVACVAPFVILDAFEPMWEVLYTFTVRYVKQAPGASHADLWPSMVYGGPALWAGAIAWGLGLAGHVLARRFRAVERGVLWLSLCLFAWLSVHVQQRFFSYHYTVLSPLLAGALLYGLLTPAPGRRPFVPFLAALCLATCACLAEPRANTNPRYSYAKHIGNGYRYLRGELSRKAYLAPFSGMNALDRYWVHEQVGLAAKARARPGDALCARGFATAIYQVSGMRCPSRHVMQAWPAGLPTWEPEFWNTISANPPRFIVTFRDRPREIRRLQKMGYRGTRMPSLFLLMDRAGAEITAPVSTF